MEDDELMRLAYEEACKALDEQEVPIGCVVYDPFSARLLATGRNATNAKRNGTRHAELEALDRLPASIDFAELTLAVTVEPCIMCAYVLRSLRFGRVLFGARNERFGGCGSIYNADQADVCLDLPPLHIKQLDGHVARNVNLLRRFYMNENKRAPEDKRSSKRQRIFKAFTGGDHD